MTTQLKEPQNFLNENEKVEVFNDGMTIILRYSRLHSTSTFDMVRYRRDENILSIFPRANSAGTFEEQFHQVLEIQIIVPYSGWDADSPVGESERYGQFELSGLPKGFGKIFEYGLGIRQPYQGIIHEIEDKTSCTVVRFNPPGEEGVIGNVFHISLARFSNYVGEVDLHRRRGDTVVRRINSAVAQNTIADITGDAKVEPKLGRLGQIQAMTRAISDNAPLNVDERSALVTRMSAEARVIVNEQPESFGKLRDDFELLSLESLINSFETNLSGKGASNENAWQKFFVDNTFALKQIFASPVAYYGEQISVRIPDMKGVGAQIADFVLANTLTRSMVVVEIKTPATKLTGQAVYRGKSSAKIYPPTTELSGGIAQLQAQMESARTDFDLIMRKTPDSALVDTKIVTGAVIVGRLDSLNQLQKESFVRYRHGLHGIEVITFDEVLERLRDLHEMLQESRKE